MSHPTRRLPGAQLPSTHFDGHKNIDGAGADALAALLNERATITKENVHIYVDVASGDDDAGDGSAAFPLKTIAAALAAMPDVIAHDSVIHVDGGQETLTSSLIIDKHILYGKRLVIDGGDDWTDTGEGVLTATGSSVSSLTVAGGLATSADDHAGYFVKVLTGPAAGDIRLVHKNTTTVLTPSKNFSADPGVGATFQVVRPTNGITDDGSWYDIEVEPSGAGFVTFNRMYFSASSLYFYQDAGRLEFAACVFNGGDVFVSTADIMQSSLSLFDTSGTALASSSSNPGLGVVAGDFYITGCNAFKSFGMVFKGQLNLIDVRWIKLNYGFRALETVSMYGCAGTQSGGGIDTASGYATTTFESAASGVGLLVAEGSNVHIKSAEIANTASHAIEVDNSRLWITSNLASAGGSIVGAGIYAHNNATVDIKSGVTPTISGTVGEVSFEGSHQIAAWSDVVATPYAYAGTRVGKRGVENATKNVMHISPNGAARIQAFSEEEITLNTGSTTKSSTGTFPASAFNCAVAARITEGITTASSCTLGDGSTADCFGTFGSMALNTTLKGAPASDASIDQSGANVVVTTNVNPGAGKIRVAMSWEELVAPQA